MDTLILILYTWHIEGKKTKRNTAWVEMCSISNKNKMTWKQLLSPFWRLFVQQQIAYWSLSQNWWEPTHALPVRSIVGDPTPSVAPFHIVSIPIIYETKNKCISNTFPHPHKSFCLFRGVFYLEAALPALPRPLPMISAGDNEIRRRKYSIMLWMIQCPSVPPKPPHQSESVLLPSWRPSSRSVHTC